MTNRFFGVFGIIPLYVAAVSFSCLMLSKVYRNFSSSRNVSEAYRPARTLQGRFGSITVPDSRDKEACKAFKEEQILLSMQAAMQQNENRMWFHYGNQFLASDNPIAKFYEAHSNFPFPRSVYNIVKADLKKYLKNVHDAPEGFE